MPRDCPTTPSDAPPAPAVRPPGTPQWVTAELLADTLAVWQPFYSHKLTEQDALEMLRSAAHLLEALGDDDEIAPQVRSPGAG